MPRALIGTDDPTDRAIAAEVQPALEGLGFEVRVLSPMNDIGQEVLREAISRSRVDVVCLVANRRYLTTRRRVRDGGLGTLREVEVLHDLERGASFEHAPERTRATDPFDVAEDIRHLPSQHSFAGEVKACSTPILVVFTTAEAASAFGREQKPKWCHEFSTEALASPMRDALLDLLAEWREALLSELQWSGHSLVLDDRGRYSFRSTFRRREIDGEIVTPNTHPDGLGHAGFLIASGDLERVIAPVQQFEWLISNYRTVARALRTKPEEVFQRFLDEHPHFLKGDAYQQHFAKPRLPIPEAPGRFLEPDFVLRPHGLAAVGPSWKILDVKLPDVSLVVNRRFHPQLSHKLSHAIQQLRDYRKYFGRPDARPHLEHELGHSPTSPKIAVLIGNASKEPQLENFGAVIDSANAHDVQVITYDELLEQRRRVVLASAAVLERLGQLPHQQR